MNRVARTVFMMCEQSWYRVIIEFLVFICIFCRSHDIQKFKFCNNMVTIHCQCGFVARLKRQQHIWSKVNSSLSIDFSTPAVSGFHRSLNCNKGQSLSLSSRLIIRGSIKIKGVIFHLDDPWHKSRIDEVAAARASLLFGGARILRPATVARDGVIGLVGHANFGLC